MKVTYRREMKYNYLIIDPEELSWEGYESRMITQNSVEGLLPVKIRQTEDGVRFCYEITSRQPLLRLMQRNKLKSEEIRNLIIGIFHAIENMEEYLLSEKHVLLDSEYLYIEPDSYRVFLCLVPGLESSFPESFGKLLEQILEHVDHQDKDSVVLAYRLYQESRKENYGIEDIMKLLYQNEQEKNAMTWNDDAEVKQDADTEEAKGQTGTFWNSEYGYRQEHEIKPSQHCLPRAEQEQSRSESWWERLCRWVARKCKGHKKEMPVQVPWEMMVHKESLREWEEDRPDQDKKESSPENQRNTDIQGTILLADLTGNANTGNRVLRALDTGMEDIKILYYPFIIGKQERLVDYCLDYETVSRLHLRIDRVGESYYLQDLNSMNGTSLRGRMLINNETDEIRIGDEICIAQYRYIFE